MSNYVKEMVKTRAIEFVKDLRGKCEMHVSETFIINYLTKSFVTMHKHNPHALEITIAYSVALPFFKELLQEECELNIDGQTIAENFASRFSEKPIYL